VDSDFLSPVRGLCGLLQWAVTMRTNQAIRETCLINFRPVVFSHVQRIRTNFLQEKNIVGRLASWLSLVKHYYIVDIFAN
jgi:hypothetical protein